LYWFKNNKLRKNSSKVRKALLPVILYHPVKRPLQPTLPIPVHREDATYRKWIRSLKSHSPFANHPKMYGKQTELASLLITRILMPFSYLLFDTVVKLPGARAKGQELTCNKFKGQQEDS
jgi:hypothetical protein